MPETVRLDKKIAAKGAEIAQELQKVFHEKGIYVVNLIGSPGSGKTSLLEAMAPKIRGEAAVIEGDIETEEDKKRIERVGLPAHQIQTRGACHLDAGMIEAALREFSVDGVRFLFIENVGNLVCPSSFAIGEDIKVSVISIAEGSDKPIKYPAAIRVSSAMVLTKTDLAPYVDCDLEKMERDARAVNPAIETFRVSCRTGEGVGLFVDWLKKRHERMTSTARNGYA